MRYYKEEEKTLNRYEFEPQANEITMFNSENELTNLMDAYLPELEDCRVYINGELSQSVEDLSELFKVLKENGFGADYTVTWSFYTMQDDSGSEFGVISLNLGK